MRLSQIIARVRDVLKDTNTNKYTFSDAKVGAVINDSIRTLIRHAVEADPSYHNFRLDLPGSEAVEKSSGHFQYRIPRWVVSIADVRETAATGAPEGERVRRMRSRGERDGWMLEQTRVLRLHHPSALDLTLYVAKLPARLTQGTLPAQASESTIRLDQDAAATEFPHDSEEDVYGNAIFELTTAAKVGIFGVGASSTPRNNSGGLYFTDVVLEEAMTGKAEGDTYEMHSEIPDEHMTLVILHAARKLLSSMSNMQAMAAHDGEYQYELRRYIESLQPRQSQGPLAWSVPGEEDGLYTREDPDSMMEYPF